MTKMSSSSSKQQFEASLLDVFTKSQYKTNHPDCLQKFSQLMRQHFTEVNCPFADTLMKLMCSALNCPWDSNFTKSTLLFFAKALKLLEEYEDELKESKSHTSDTKSDCEETNESASDISDIDLMLRDAALLDSDVQSDLESYQTYFQYIILCHIFYYVQYKAPNVKHIALNSMYLLQNILSIFKEMDLKVFKVLCKLCCLLTESSFSDIRQKAILSLGFFLQYRDLDDDDKEVFLKPEKILIEKATSAFTVGERIIALKVLPINERTIDIFFERVFDISPQIRKSVYIKLGRLTAINNFKLHQRLRILNMGFLEKDEQARKAFISKLLVSWIENQETGNFRGFLQRINLHDNLKLAKNLTFTYLTYLHQTKDAGGHRQQHLTKIYGFVFNFRGKYLDEQRLLKSNQEGGTPELVFFWANLVHYCKTKAITYHKKVAKVRTDEDDGGSQEENVTFDLVDEVQPEAIHYAEYMQEKLRLLIELRKADNADAGDIKEATFAFSLLLDLISMFEVVQSIQMEAIKKLVADIATNDDLYGIPDDYYLEKLMKNLGKMPLTCSQYIECLMNIVNDINFPPWAEISESETVAAEAELSELRTLLGPELLADIEEDEEAGEMATGETRRLVIRFKELNTKLAGPAPRATTSDIVRQRILHLVLGALLSRWLGAGNNSIDQLHKDVIMHAFQNPGRDFKLAVKALGHYCMHSVDAINDHIFVFFELIQRRQTDASELTADVCIDALQLVFDFVQYHGLESFAPIRPTPGYPLISDFLKENFGDAMEVSFKFYFLQLIWEILKNCPAMTPKEYEGTQPTETLEEKIFHIAVVGSCKLINNKFISLDNLLACKFIARHWCISVKLANHRSPLLGCLQFHLKRQLGQLIEQKKDKFITETVLGTLMHMAEGDMPVSWAQYQMVLNMMPVERVMPNKMLISLARAIQRGDFTFEVDNYMVKAFKQIFEIYLPKPTKKTTKAGDGGEAGGFHFSREDLENLAKRLEAVLSIWSDELQEQYDRVKAKLAEVKQREKERVDSTSEATTTDISSDTTTTAVTGRRKRGKEDSTTSEETTNNMSADITRNKDNDNTRNKDNDNTHDIQSDADDATGNEKTIKRARLANNEENGQTNGTTADTEVMTTAAAADDEELLTEQEKQLLAMCRKSDDHLADDDNLFD